MSDGGFPQAIQGLASRRHPQRTLRAHRAPPLDRPISTNSLKSRPEISSGTEDTERKVRRKFGGVRVRGFISIPFPCLQCFPWFTLEFVEAGSWAGRQGAPKQVRNLHRHPTQIAPDPRENGDDCPPYWAAFEPWWLFLVDVPAGATIAQGKPMRAIWKGSISFGLVNVPVGLYSATRPGEEIKFHLLRTSDKSRIQYKRVAESDGRAFV